MAATRSDSFLGERYRRVVKPPRQARGAGRVARSILVIVWHLLADRTTRFCDLAPATTPNRIAKTARPAATSANWKPSAAPSPSHPA
jgi:transposase